MKNFTDMFSFNLKRTLHELTIVRVRRARDGPGVKIINEIKNNTLVRIGIEVRRLIQSEVYRNDLK